MISLRPNQTFINETKFRSWLYRNNDYSNEVYTTDSPNLEKMKVFTKTLFANLIEFPIAGLTTIVALIESVVKTVINGFGYLLNEKCESQFAASLESVGISLGYLLACPFTIFYRIMQVWGRAINYHKPESTLQEKALATCIGIHQYGVALQNWAADANNSDRAPRLVELFQLLLLF